MGVKVGLTGGAGSGKSSVGRMFRELGAEVIDADELARKVLEPGSEALEEVRRVFGPRVILPTGQLNRGLMREIIFSDPRARRRLEQIVHPRVAEAMARMMDASNAPVVVAEVPLLFEAGWEGWFNRIVVVWVPRDVQIARLVRRDNISPAQAMAMIRAQLPLDEKRARAHFIVDNSGSLEQTRRQVESLWAALARSG